MAFRPLRRAFAATLVFVAALDAAAQVFPSKPVRIVIGFPPGGGIDIVAPRLTEALGQPVLVENRPGANGVVGMDLVAKAAPDGHTVMLGTLGTLSVNPSFYPNLPFNAETAFAPDMPTVAETLPGFEVVNWYGMAVPAGTPCEAINRLHAELVKAMALPDVREKMVAQGTDPVGSTPEAFGAFVKAESAKWIRVIRQANIKPD